MKVVDIKPVVKALPKQFDHNDKMVREQAKQCAVELFRWIRDAIKPTLQGIKPVQVRYESVYDRVLASQVYVVKLNLKIEIKFENKIEI